MKSLKNEATSNIGRPPRQNQNKEPYEIIYADPRDKEIHLNILSSSRVNAHMARWFLDWEINQLIWSDGVFEILEIDSKRNGASYSNFISLVHPEDKKLRDQLQNELKGTIKPIEITYRLLFNHGRVKWVNEICNTDFDQDGQPIRSYGTIQDITKYKISEEKFRQKEERYKRLLDSIPTAIVICERNRIIYLNSAGKKILGGNSSESLKGKLISKNIHPDSKRNFRKNVGAASSGEIEIVFEDKMLRLDGSEFEAEVTVSNTNYRGKPAIQYIINDITERKKSDQLLKDNSVRLKELNATKDKFFSIIAHDLRSPINSILGFLDLLINQYEEIEDQERKAFIKLIEENVNVTQKLLDNLLHWALSQSGKISFKPEKIHLSNIVQNIFETFRTASKLKKIDLLSDVSPDFTLFADVNMLTTILQNLTNNAIKYSNTGGSISINVESNSNQDIIVVSDNGIGMNEKTKNMLFKVGEHISSPGTADEIGSGLGLILCKDFIDRHHGEIWVESEEGKGSKFFVRIPQK